LKPTWARREDSHSAILSRQTYLTPQTRGEHQLQNKPKSLGDADAPKTSTPNAFRIGEKSDHTLEEVGQKFTVTGNYSQIEAKALRNSDTQPQ